MKTPIIDRNHIKMIPINEDIALFFHTETLQIYPINDCLLRDFITSYSKSNKKDFKKKYTEDEIEEGHDFIYDKIIKAPKTFLLEVDDRSEPTYSATVFPISAKCNLCCPYCFARVDNGFDFGDFTIDSVEKNVDFIMSKNSQTDKPISITFFGGEPLLNINAMIQTIEYIKKQYPERLISYSITTNGTILSNDIIQLLKDNNIIVLVSIDGPASEYNLRSYKNGESSVSDVIKNIGILKKNGIYTEIRATLVCNNPLILETFDFFENIEIPFFVSFAYSSENKLHDLSIYTKTNLNSIKSQINKLEEYYRLKMEKGQQIYNKKFSKINSILRYRNIQNIACGAGRTYFTITADGSIYSCAHFMNDKRFKIGDVHKMKTLKKNLRAEQIKYIKECKDCWAKYLCLGNCFAQKISLGKTAKMSLPENECQLELLLTEFYIKLYYYANVYNKEKYLQDLIETN